MINFVRETPICTVTGSQYNPRKITDEALADLEESIRKFGMVKPLIINRNNNVIIAGHQRKKAAQAVGIETLPCVFVSAPSPQDEMLFNLLHNSIETSDCKVSVLDFTAGDYKYCENAGITLNGNTGSLLVCNEIMRLICSYGEWGSVVCDEEGNVLLNAEYAVVAKNCGYGLLVYCIPDSEKAEFMKYIGKDYGVYNYDAVPIKTYHQFCAQPNRFSVTGRSKGLSRLYEKYIIPQMAAGTRVIDIGAGRMKYVDMLKSKKHDILGYEPAFRVKGKNNIDIKSIVKHIRLIADSVKQNGLFDICVLETVINSVIDDNFESVVLTACNNLLKPGGVLITCTRNIKTLDGLSGTKRLFGRTTAGLYFLDDKNYTVGLMNGIVFKQKFHTVESYITLLERFFGDVTALKIEADYIYCAARNPKNLNLAEVEQALNEEFNIEYPNGFRHNKQDGLVTAVMKRLRERYGQIGQI